MSRKKKELALEFHPLTVDKWKDFEELFGDRGACGGCWCMWWRLRQKEFEAGKGKTNRRAMKKLVSSGNVPGILAYCEGKAVAWCSVAPRDEYTRLERSRILKPVDDQAVWSVICFFIEKSFRRKGVSVRLLKAAAEFVRGQGGKILEGYPVEPKKESMPDVFAFHGLAQAFKDAGFKEVARRSETRPIMRFLLNN